MRLAGWLDSVRTRRAARAGFSLAELMVAVLILAIVSTMSVGAFVTLNRSKDAAMRRADLTERGRVLAELITNELKASITLPSGQERVSGISPTRYRLFGWNDTENGTAVDMVALADLRGPSYQRDEDGDGLVDEDPWNGIDDDGDGAVDEDPGRIPRDILNFVASVANPGLLDVAEVGYAISPVFGLDQPSRYLSDRLFRRLQYFNNTTDVRLFGRFVEDNGRDRGLLRNETEFVSIALPSFSSTRGPMTIQEQAELGLAVEVVDYDVVGLDIYYWYYDFDLPGWAFTENWDSGLETSLEEYEDDPRWRNNFGRRVFNEADDLDSEQKDISNDHQAVRKREPDGLPYLVEVRVFVQDNARESPPKMFSSRVYLPSS